MESPEYWKQIQDLLNEALERAPQDRQRFLAGIPDSAVRNEVDSLLNCRNALSDEQFEESIRAAAQDWAGTPQPEAKLPPNFSGSSKPELDYKLDDRPVSGFRPVHSRTRETRFKPGEILSNRYRIVALLGSGGMGEVYRAEDLTLIQPVALKFLPQAAASDERRRQRLHSEVRIARQVSHPNVCRVYDIGEVHGCPYISMEYVDGEDLNSLLRRIGRLPPDKAVEFARKLGAGLAAAHEKGILHRDLKPANIMIDGRGEVLITDFGLAGLIGQVNGQEVRNGTPAYMAPEQLAGKEVSVQSDIYSLGLVMYEMFTGQRAFEDGARRQSPSRISSFVKDVQPAVERVIGRCLAANPENRPSSATAVVAALPSGSRPHTPLPGRKTPSVILAGREIRWISIRAVVISAVVVLAAIATAITLRYRGASIESSFLLSWLTRDRTPAFAPRETPVTRYVGYEFQPSISPNGSEVAFVWNGTPSNYDLYVKLLDAEKALRLTTNPAHDLHPSWSPDGHSIMFLRLYPDERKEVFTISALGGSERFLYRTHASRPRWAQGENIDTDRFPGPAWSPEGKFFAISDRFQDSDPDAIFFVPLASGARRRFTSPDRGYVGDYLPCFSPDGTKLAFIRMTNQSSGSDVYVQSVKGNGTATRITFDNVAISGLAWLSPDELVFSSDRSDGSRLWKIRAHGGTPSAVAGVRGAEPSASRDGRFLIYTRSFGNTNIWRLALNRNGPSARPPVRLISSSSKSDSAQYSPDGSRIVFVSDRSGKPEIWTCLADGSETTSIAFPKGTSIGTPRWSPDGQSIAYDTDLNGHSVIEIISAGGGEPRLFAALAGEDEMMPSWSRDGRYIYYSSARGGAEAQIWKKQVDGGPPLQVTQHGGGDRAESPDGKLLYYVKPPGIWQVPVSGGNEEIVRGLEHASVSRLFSVTHSGVYFLSTSASPWTIRFLSFSTHQTTAVANIEGDPEFGTPSLSVSPDEHWLLYSQVDQSGADLMMLQNFH